MTAKIKNTAGNSGLLQYRLTNKFSTLYFYFAME
jgi:hypothetical protein